MSLHFDIVNDIDAALQQQSAQTPTLVMSHHSIVTCYLNFKSFLHYKLLIVFLILFYQACTKNGPAKQDFFTRSYLSLEDEGSFLATFLPFFPLSVVLLHSPQEVISTFGWMYMLNAHVDSLGDHAVSEKWQNENCIESTLPHFVYKNWMFMY